MLKKFLLVSIGPILVASLPLQAQAQAAPTPASDDPMSGLNLNQGVLSTRAQAAP